VGAGVGVTGFGGAGVGVTGVRVAGVGVADVWGFLRRQQQTMHKIIAPTIEPTTIPAMAPALSLSGGVGLGEGFEVCEYVGAELDVVAT
jgi:hypothetical protein